MEELKSMIREIPDFPKPGILFYDVTTLFENPKGLKKSLDLLEEFYRDQSIDKVAGIESRGFILGGALADRLGCGFVVIRKKGKLPWKTVSESYELEYGTDDLEVHVDAIKENERVLIVDDLLATGGTLEASAKLVTRLKGEIVGMTCVIELLGLNGRDRLKDYPLHTLLAYEGE
jgi:adenine phosphoribosyltransferase